MHSCQQQHDTDSTQAQIPDFQCGLRPWEKGRKKGFSVATAWS